MRNPKTLFQPPTPSPVAGEGQEAPPAREVDKDGERCANDRTAVINRAGRLLAAIQDACPKYSEHMSGHSGTLLAAGNPSSGAVLQGRDRSTAAVAARNKEKLAALSGETGEDGELTPKKKVSGIGWAKLAHID
jgi:hypothetical protein